MHPRIEREPFTASGWLFQHKLDGFRALAIVEAGDVQLLSRSGRSLGEQLTEIVRALRTVAAEVVVQDRWRASSR